MATNRKKQSVTTCHNLSRSVTALPPGQSLVEALVALAVVVLVVTGLVALGIQTVRGAVSARNRAFAYQKAQEETELVRAVRDQAYSDLTSCPNNTADCHVLWSGSTWVVTVGGREPIDGMQRWFRRINLASNRDRVVVSVQWSDPSGTHTVTVNTVLTNWR